jgi:hypothetical protein
MDSESHTVKQAQVNNDDRDDVEAMAPLRLIPGEIAGMDDSFGFVFVDKMRIELLAKMRIEDHSIIGLGACWSVT